MYRKLTSYLLMLAVFSSLSACGGGIAGIDGSGSRPSEEIHGSVNGFGSIIVDGVRYDTSEAEILIGGEPGTEQQLKVGDYLTIIGETAADGATGIARQVFYQDILAGPISTVDVEANRFTLLGYTVQLSHDTSFDSEINPASIEGLASGTQVKVSGPSSHGTIYATRVRAKNDKSVSLSGVISKLDENEKSFNLGHTSIGYTQATLTGELDEGVGVIIRGSIVGVTEFEARTVEVVFGASLVNRDRDIKIEGKIWNFNEDQRFNILNYKVDIDTRTTFENGQKIDIDDGWYIIVSGNYDKSRNTITANKIQFKDEADTKISGVISDLELKEHPEHRHLDQRIITINDAEIKVDGKTRFENRHSGQQGSSIDDLRLGEHLIVYAIMGNDQYYATRVEVVSQVVE